ncbi:MAG: DUF2027 domain-containing protein [Bacteroidales bacterium]|nr:DUF2027 domain-containing protein [Bacteroidales bacterium]
MLVKIGSRVKFLNDTGGGVVKGFSGDKMALVETDDGFEVPVLVTDLLIEESVGYGMGDEHEQEVTVEKQPEVKPAEKKQEIGFEEKKFSRHQGEIVVAFVPENEQVLHVSNFGFYLINDSNYYIDYVAYIKDSGVYTLLTKGSIEPDTKIMLESFSQTRIAKIREVRIQGIYYKHGLLEVSEPLDISYSLEGISFYKTGFFKENEYFDGRALIFKKEEFDMKTVIESLSEGEISNVAKIKEAEQEKKKSAKAYENLTEEVDLHIEEIIDDHKEMSNGEIINIQLGRFETALETALRGKTKKIIFIHGVGNGKLKYEMRKKLDRKYPDLKYQDASFREYGYGATIVYLK